MTDCRREKQIFAALKKFHFASFMSILQFQCFIFLENVNNYLK